MLFKLNIQIVFNATCLFILESWTEACKRAVSMTYEPTCTSGLDGKHSDHSGHYYGRALDFRSRDVDYHLRENLKQAAQEILGPHFLVLLEQNHFHIQRQHDSFGGSMVPPTNREIQ